MPKPPNIVFFLADQLRAQSAWPLEQQVELPAMRAMADAGMRLNHAVSTCPLCTPYRGMLMTGRYPQTTGMIVNFTSTRYSEIGLGDAFAHAGYRTGYVGKWHLNRGAFPSEAMDFIPIGRARLGFDFWRAYNCHIDFWDGHINGTDWDTVQWKGYETHGLLDYVREFMAADDGRPYFLVVSPHQPHWNWKEVSAPQEYYDRLPKDLALPPDVPERYRAAAFEQYRNYMAMILALDEMLGATRKLVGDDTLFVFTSDHGTQMGSHLHEGEGGNAWGKSRPYAESVSVPFTATWPGHIAPGSQSNEMITPVDIFPTLCGLAGVPIPRTVEGVDLSDLFYGQKPAASRDIAYLMSFHNYVYTPNLIRADGKEWRGVRTHRYTYARWREGLTELFDREKDPRELTNLAGNPDYVDVERHLAAELKRLMAAHHDDLHPYGYYRDWIDQERRIVRNAHGPLPHPEEPPDWSLLHPVAASR